MKRPTASIAGVRKRQETQGWALAASPLSSSAPSTVGGNTNLDPLPVAVCLGALRPRFLSSILTELDTNSCPLQPREIPKRPPTSRRAPPFPTPEARRAALGPSPGAQSLLLQALPGDPRPLLGVRGGDSGFGCWSKLPLGPPSRLCPSEKN